MGLNKGIDFSLLDNDKKIIIVLKSFPLEVKDIYIDIKNLINDNNININAVHIKGHPEEKGYSKNTH